MKERLSRAMLNYEVYPVDVIEAKVICSSVEVEGECRYAKRMVSIAR